MSLKNTYIVEKSNVLNEIKSTNMTLQELRFFSIYLAKINARDVSTRRVRFPLSDFQKIMGIGRMNIQHFKTTVNGLLCKVVHIPNDRGGLCSFQLFKEVDLFKDDSDLWVVEIDAHDKALPLMFNLKGHYFTYELWNALRLNSINQVRMYELLKQHERTGDFEIRVSELRELLGIAPNQYDRLRDFKTRVLDSCQKALSENTNICYTYEKGKAGSHGKWLTIVFHISKNTLYKDPIQLEDFIKKQPAPKQDKPECVPEYVPNVPNFAPPTYEQPEQSQQFPIPEYVQEPEPVTKAEHEYSSERIAFYASAFKEEFSELEINDFLSLTAGMPLPEIVDPYIPKGWNMALYNFFHQIYSKFLVKRSQTTIYNGYSYIRGMIINERDKQKNKEKLYD